MYWEENEVNQLKTSFFQGLSLKAMAKILNKSPGAVNKALTRFNIRPTKKPKSIWSLSMLNAAPKPHKKNQNPYSLFAKPQRGNHHSLSAHKQNPPITGFTSARLSAFLPKKVKKSR